MAETDFEIERRWLVASPGWKRQVVYFTFLRQGYLSVNPERTVRIRLESGDIAPVLCIKGRAAGLKTPEVETDVGRGFAEQALSLCGEDLIIEKLRHRIQKFMQSDPLIVVDEFMGRHRGLFLAEVEFADEAAAEAFTPPDWFGAEVTDDPRYRSAVLVQHGLPS